jgi:hypothetical protein
MSSVRLLVVLGVGVIALAFLVFAYDPGAVQPVPRHGAPTAAADVGANLPGGLSIGEPLVLGNLAIFSVSSREPRMDDRFITLDEGLKAGTVEILEKGAVAANSGNNPQPDPFAAPPDAAARPALPNSPAGVDPFAEPPPAPASPANEASAPAADPPSTNASEATAQETAQQSSEPAAEIDPFAPAGNEVNGLLVVNRSEKPLYLMPGEIIVGGDQDRTIGEELVIAPDGKPVEIDVFCVEHGRWGGRAEADYAGLIASAHQPQRPFVTSVVPVVDADALAAPVVADFDSLEETTAAANSGKFVGSVGSLSKAARLAVQKGAGQSAVWDEVANENAKAGVETASGTFASNYSDQDAVERLEPYLQHFKQPIEDRENIVGVIVAVNGQVESLDVFESTPLFRKLWPKLLKSYALDAANAAAAGEEIKAVTRADAIAFFQDVATAQAEGARAQAAQSTDSLAVSRGENERVLLFTAHDRRVGDANAAASPSVNGGTGLGGGMGGMGSFGGAIHSAGFSQ